MTENLPKTLTCPSCGGEVEIWSDEKSGKCISCKKKFSREEVGK